MSALIGISCCNKPFGVFETPNHAASDACVQAVDRLAGGVPILLPALGRRTDIDAILEHCAGLLLTGSRSHVAPLHYGGHPHERGTPEDLARDETTLPLIRAALARGTPILAICRGMQELNVALGGTLHQRLNALPGRFDHATPMVQDAAIRTAKAHRVTLTPGGLLHRLAQCRVLDVNSLHHQGVDRLGAGLVTDAQAPDGTIEALRAPASPGWVLGVQWHPEFDADRDSVSARIFEAFGDAARRFARDGSRVPAHAAE